MADGIPHSDASDEMSDHMAELGRRMRQRRSELSLRQQDVADLAADFDPDAGLNIYSIGNIERGVRQVMLTPREVRALEHALRWQPGTVLQICGYLEPGTIERAETRSEDVIATLMDAADLTAHDKHLVRDMVRSMARRQDGPTP